LGAGLSGFLAKELWEASLQSATPMSLLELSMRLTARKLRPKVTVTGASAGGRAVAVQGLPTKWLPMGKDFRREKVSGRVLQSLGPWLRLGLLGLLGLWPRLSQHLLRLCSLSSSLG